MASGGSTARPAEIRLAEEEKVELYLRFSGA